MSRKEGWGEAPRLPTAGVWGGEATGLDLASSPSLALALPLSSGPDRRTSHKLALYLPKQPFYPHLTLSGDPALQGEKWSKANPTPSVPFW